MKGKQLIKSLNVMIILVAVLALINVRAVADEKTNDFKYEHDPRTNSKAMEDIIVDPEAVFGFAPAPDSTRLGSYTSYDWSDPAVVNKAVKDRIDYLLSYNDMFSKWEEMKKAGKSTEEIARTVSAMRNQMRLDSYKDDPVGLAKVKESNLKTYGNENGPTADSLFEKYGSWDKVITKSFSSNCGMDACLGLYDIQYEHNIQTGEIKEVNPVVYTIKENDSLSKIAKKYYGDKASWILIYNANKDTIKDANKIYPNVKIIIPLD